MSNNNGNDGGAAMGLALVFAVIYFIGIIAYTIACFLAVICTVIALCAWDKPLRLFGEHICGPLEARIFIGTGLAGAVAVPAFALFCSLLLDFPIKDEWWFYLVTAGYSIPPFIVIGKLAELHPNGLPGDTGAVVEHVPNPSVPSLPPAPKSFDYASWDDEKPGGNPNG